MQNKSLVSTNYLKQFDIVFPLVSFFSSSIKLYKILSSPRRRKIKPLRTASLHLVMFPTSLNYVRAIHRKQSQKSIRVTIEKQFLCFLDYWDLSLFPFQYSNWETTIETIRFCKEYITLVKICCNLRFILSTDKVTLIVY